MKNFNKYALAGLVAVLASVQLTGCGGGSSSASSSSGSGSGNSASGTVSGTVTGFGSVIVDGKEYPEVAGTSYFTAAYGNNSSLAADAMQLGQQVDLTLDDNGNISQVVVVPEVEGTVSSITSTVTVGSSTLPAITVSGVLVTANSDSSQGPVTNFGNGYTALSSVAVNDNVEVHGLLRSSGGVDYVQATYIGKQPSFVGTRVTGTVANYSATNATFTLGSITINTGSASVLPIGTSLANGEVVNVWSTGTLSSNTLTANIIKVRKSTAVAGDTLGVSGPISSYVSQSSFVVNGVTVDASGVTLPNGITALANGEVVAVNGNVNSSGTLVATWLRVYQSAAQTAQPVELIGDINNFVSSANFSVRGVVVDASQNPTYTVSGTSASSLANGTFVDIKGTLVNNVVVASSVTIPTLPSLPATVVVDARATVTSYDNTTGALVISVNVPGSNTPLSISTTLGSSVTYNNGNDTNLTAGTAILVHGVYTIASESLAVSTITFLPTQPSASGNDVLFTGVISAVTPSTGTVTAFTLRGLTINVGTATVSTVGGSSATLAVGEPAAVLAQVGSNNTLTALKIIVGPVQDGGPSCSAASGATSGSATSGGVQGGHC